MYRRSDARHVGRVLIQSCWLIMSAPEHQNVSCPQRRHAQLSPDTGSTVYTTLDVSFTEPCKLYQFLGSS